jgi:hypothetical protein
MKEKLLVVACAVAVLSSAASLAATAAVRAHAAEPKPAADFTLKVLSEDRETRIYTFRSEGVTCFIASTIGGSGISLQCPH